MEENFDINQAKSFEEIAKIKQYVYQANLHGGIHIENILSDLYKNPTHFIFELIQNAEDAKAQKVQITLTRKELVFKHDGRAFNLKDIKGITGVNDSPKSGDITAIGHFGIGFKAVFGICDAPEIYSDEYNFRINNFYVPERIETKHEEQKIGTTLIVLPFKGELSEELYNEIESALVNMDPDTVLFLKNIKQIDYLTETKTGYFVRKKEKKEIDGDEYFETQVIGGQGVKSSYIVFEDNYQGNENQIISLAYKYDRDGQAIIEESHSSKLVVFFPTERDTFLKFKINGPYRTTPTRENVPKNSDNLSILKQTVEFYKKSLAVIKGIGLMTPQFINILPMRMFSFGQYAGNDEFYCSFYDATIEFFKENKALPTEDGDFESADNVLLARGPMTDLTNEEDNQILFGKKKWLSVEITRDKTPDVVDFLIKQLSVREVDFEFLLTNVNSTFLDNKSQDWFKLFYNRGNNNITTVKKYLTKTFIKVRSGRCVAPYIKNGAGEVEKNVYLPSKLVTDDDKVVDEDLLRDEGVKTFFNNIGITEMDIVESVRTQFLPTIIHSESEESFVDSIYILYLVYCDQTTSNQNALVDLLREKEFMLLVDEDGFHYFKPNKFFFGHGISKELYDGVDGVKFVCDALDKKAQEEQSFYSFLRSIGIHDSIMILKVNNGLSYEERNLYLDGAEWSSWEDASYDISKIDEILDNITEKKSKALWSAVNNVNNSFYTGTFSWSYYGKRKSKSHPSRFITKLQEAKWLFNDEGEAVSPTEIYEDDVRSLYGGGPILNHLEFKPNTVKLLPAEDQRRLELAKKIPIEALEQFLEQYNQLTTPKEVDIHPEEMSVDIEEAEVGITVTDIEPSNSSEGKTAEEIIEGSEKQESDLSKIVDDLYSDVNIPTSIIDKIVAKRVSNEAEVDGELGERFVISGLRTQYKNLGYEILNDSQNSFTARKDGKNIDVSRQNRNGKIQKGYDILVSDMEGEIEYIEVKSKKGNEKEFFKVSGLQWEFAKKLNEEGKGDKHYVYIVTNVRDKEKIAVTRMKNPYKAWLEGKLEVDPVRIKY